MMPSKKSFGPEKNLEPNMPMRFTSRIVANSNIQERLNGEFRDREKVFRGLKKDDSPPLQESSYTTIT